MIMDTSSSRLPWYETEQNKIKAFIKVGGETITALDVIEGPKGIALAIFQHCPPLEIPSLKNSVLAPKVVKAQGPKSDHDSAAKANGQPKQKGKSATKDTLIALEKKTQNYIKELGLTSSSNGVKFYEKGSRFQLDWHKGAERGQLTTKAKGEDDEDAEKATHLKFHEVASNMN